MTLFDKPRYVAPPLPKVGDRVHTTGAFPSPGVVRVVLTDEPHGPMFVVRYWFKHKRRYHYDCVHRFDWEYGMVRPGPVPRERRKARP